MIMDWLVYFLIGLVIGCALGAATLAGVLAWKASRNTIDIDWTNATRR